MTDFAVYLYTMRKDRMGSTPLNDAQLGAIDLHAINGKTVLEEICDRIDGGAHCYVAHAIIRNTTDARRAIQRAHPELARPNYRVPHPGM